MTDPLPRTIRHTLSIGPLSVAVHDTGGSGPAVLLVHGNSSSSRIWQPLLESPAAAHLRLVALDLPGHGQSADAPAADRAGAYSIPGYAAVVQAVAAQQGLAKPVLVGWSLGGHAVLEAAAGLPGVAGVMVFGTPPLPYPPAADFGGAFLKLGLGFVADWTPEQAQEYVSDFMAPGQPAPAFMLADALRTDGQARAMLAASVGTVGYRDELQIVRSLACPLAVLQGAQEVIVNPAYLDSLAPTLPTLWRGAVQTVAGAGHALPWEQPATFAALLQAFVADCPTDQPANTRGG